MRCTIYLPLLASVPALLCLTEALPFCTPVCCCCVLSSLSLSFFFCVVHLNLETSRLHVAKQGQRTDALVCTTHVQLKVPTLLSVSTTQPLHFLLSSCSAAQIATRVIVVAVSAAR